MDLNNIGCIASSYSSSKNLKAKLIKKYNFIDCQDKNAKTNDIKIIVALGGDGFMLRAMHRFAGKGISIFGINCGSFGFLLNLFCEDEDLIKILSESVSAQMFPIFASVESCKGRKKDYIYAFNEIYIIRSGYQTAHLNLEINDISNVIVSDGILISTSQGSTAYNASCGGVVLPHDSDFLCVTPINLLKPKGMKSFVIHRENVDLSIKAINPERREVQVCADFINIKNVDTVKIVKKKEKDINLLFRRERDFNRKILETQMFA